MPELPIRVRSVTVQKLFGLYTHALPLNLDERATIIHGPNGVGKTMVLRLLAALFSGRLTDFSRVPLQKFEVILTDNSRLSVEHAGPAHRNQRQPTLLQAPLKVSATDADGTTQTHLLEYGQREFVEWQLALSEIPWLERLSEDRWIDNRTQFVMTTNEAISRNTEYLNTSRRGRIVNVEPDFFAASRSRVSVHLIETQRLLRMPSQDSVTRRSHASSMIATVRENATELHRKMNEALAKYASESQSLDQSFPQRLLRSKSEELTVEQLKKRMSDLDESRKKLKGLGLLDDSASYPFNTETLEGIGATERSVMTLYVQDTAHKLGVLDDIARRIELLRDNVNDGKFLHKSIRFDRESGYRAIGHDGNPLDSDSLSSGEQHELVLLYDLLFKVKPNTLVMVDEPELSLHVAWQKKFLPELLQIVQAAQFDALVATHSPFIVGDRSDLMVALSTEIA